MVSKEAQGQIMSPLDEARLADLLDLLTPSEQTMLMRASQLGLISAMPEAEQKAIANFIARLVHSRRRGN